jgi:Zn-dependent protease
MVEIDDLRRIDPGYRRPRPKIKFSRMEIRDILIAVLVLSLAFSVVLYSGSYLASNTIINMLLVFAVSVVLVTCSFLLHELGHKYVAQSYGAWSEFRMYPLGLFIALIFSLFGFLFAAPGAVYIQGNITNDQNGKISIAGPGVNFVIAAIATVLCFFTGGVMFDILFMLAYLNAFLGVFNMIPIPPLDGFKVVKWNIWVFAVALCIGVVELLVLLYVF